MQHSPFHYNTDARSVGSFASRFTLATAGIDSMKFIVWLIRILVFIVLLVLALANTQEATLNFVGGYAWHAPLILIGLAFFAVGLIAGLFAALPSTFRHRFEIGRLKRELKSVRSAPPPADDTPPLF